MTKFSQPPHREPTQVPVGKVVEVLMCASCPSSRRGPVLRHVQNRNSMGKVAFTTDGEKPSAGTRWEATVVEDAEGFMKVNLLREVTGKHRRLCTEREGASVHLISVATAHMPSREAQRKNPALKELALLVKGAQGWRATIFSAGEYDCSHLQTEVDGMRDLAEKIERWKCPSQPIDPASLFGGAVRVKQ